VKSVADPAAVVNAVRFDEKGLVPAIAQDRATGRVLMLAWQNAEALTLTLTTGVAHYYSRSRRAIWKKGETSGHLQAVRRVLIDCDADTVLLEVDQTGAACHEGYPTCFFREVTNAGLTVVEERVFDPDKVYRK
jgi:phosphoribosyl-AMP cyclohydrolase